MTKPSNQAITTNYSNHASEFYQKVRNARKSPRERERERQRQRRSFRQRKSEDFSIFNLLVYSSINSFARLSLFLSLSLSFCPSQFALNHSSTLNFTFKQTNNYSNILILTSPYTLHINIYIQAIRHLHHKNIKKKKCIYINIDILREVGTRLRLFVCLCVSERKKRTQLFPFTSQPAFLSLSLFRNCKYDQ